MKKNYTGAVVVLSGGQDSTTCLYWAKEVFTGPIYPVCFDYGQKHRIEIDAARKVAKMAGVASLEVIELGSKILLSTSPLVSDTPLGKYEKVEDLPGGIEPTFVPCRNLLFLTIAYNRTLAHGLRDMVTGLCQADYGGYPDCRQTFVDVMTETLQEATGFRPRIHTPLMNLTKAEIVQVARKLPGCFEALAYSHTCYEGVFPPCAKCHSCHLRQRGFEEAMIDDPLLCRD